MNMKKLISLALAMVMMLAMAVPAFAADEKGSITITNATKDYSYTIYRIFDLESYNKETGAYSYTVAEGWEEFITTGAGKDYIAVSDTGYVSWKSEKNTADDWAAFAKEAKAYADTQDGLYSETKVAAGETLVFDNLELGYYLIDSSMGTLCALDTTNPNVEVLEKNEVPANKKEVQEDSTGEWGATNDADVGQTVNFKSTITAEAGAQNYIFHDKMSAGLDFAGSVSVTLNGNNVAAENYTLVTSELGDACTFHVVFNQTFCDTLNDNDEIVITYSAVVNENAVVGVEGNPNASYISYGEDSEHETVPSKTTTYTWAMNVVKVNEQETKLAGAKFKLYTDEACKNEMKFHDLGQNVYEYCAKEKCDKAHVTEITTDATGTFKIEGLDADTYYLKETQAPAGYNKIETPIEVVVKAGETDAEGTYLATEAKVINKTGTELPSTGGMGTTMLYAAGSLMVAAAVVLLIVKRRMNAAE